MPIDRFVLILVCVLAAAGITVWLGAMIVSAFALPGLALVSAVPLGLVLFLVWRVIADRRRSAEDDRYDRIDR